jgi:hypothetical protein
MRKDLGLARADQVASVHSQVYENDKIVRITSKEEVRTDLSASERDIDALREDHVGEVVIDYGRLNSTIESLAQLRALRTTRSDLAMTSLGRAYVSNCVRSGGRWTSGIHLYWWTKKKISEIPELSVQDIRYSGSIQLSRQIELTSWSLMMFRLSFLDDIIEYAAREDDDLRLEAGVSCRAAMAVQDFSVKKLSKWLKKELVPALDARLDPERYYSLARELHSRI